MTTLTKRELERGTLRGWPFRFARSLFVPLLGRVFGLRIEGLHHVPAGGGLLVVANHLHNADPILLAVAFPRPLHFMAKKELFAVPGVGWLIRRVGTFPVDRGKPDRTAIRRVEATLAAGIAVAMFPEGTRSRSGALGRAFPGAAMLALRSEAPVLPVTIVGSERLPFNGGKGSSRSNRRTLARGDRSIVIRVEPPFPVPKVIDGRRISIEEASERIMRRIAEGLPPAYRGAYGGTETAEPDDETATASGEG